MLSLFTEEDNTQGTVGGGGHDRSLLKSFMQKVKITKKNKRPQITPEFITRRPSEN